MDESFENLLAQFVERREAGEDLELEAFLSAHPADAERLRPALERLTRTEAEFPAAAAGSRERFGRFRVLDELGRGAMGQVYEVEDPRRPGARLALKLLHLVREVDARSVERFHREGAALARIEHPGIVRCHEFGVHEGVAYLLMDCIEGRTLASLLADGSELPGSGSPAERAAQLVAALARAAEAAHAVGLLHRDLKPSNVLVRADGSPVLIDFGLVRQAGAESLTETGDVIGTARYMSPEQARGESLDARADVFSLGLILRELLSGAPARDAPDALALLRSAGELPLPRAVYPPGVPEALTGITGRATAFRMRRRYGSARELAHDLEAYLAGDSRRIRARGLAERLDDAWLSHRRDWIPLATASLGALALWLAFTSPGDSPELRARKGIARVMDAYLAAEPGAVEEAVRDFERENPGDERAAFLHTLHGAALPSGVEEPVTLALLEAQAARRAGLLDEAVERCHIARNLDGNSILTMVPLGVWALEAGDPATAQETLGFMAGAMPNSCALHQRLGESFALARDWGHAAGALETALRLCPARLEAWRALADVARASGCEDRVLRALSGAARVAANTISGPELEQLRSFAEALVEGGDEPLGHSILRELEAD